MRGNVGEMFFRYVLIRVPWWLIDLIKRQTFFGQTSAEEEDFHCLAFVHSELEDQKHDICGEKH